MITRVQNIVALLLAVALCLVGAAGQEQKTNSQSVLQFAQSFYHWYNTQVAEEVHSHNEMSPLDTALTERRSCFSPELQKALRKVRAKEKASGDVYLDSDPILNSQDPADVYEARSVAQKGGHYFANIYGVWFMPVTGVGPGPQVIAEITMLDGHWAFLNFHYPDSTCAENENLLANLKFLLSAESSRGPSPCASGRSSPVPPAPN
jgi:hypothetical protein